jgi:chaperonin cofactor prefoldin
MTTETSSGIRSAAGCLLRLLVLIVLGIGLVAVIYLGVVYGAPFLYNQYVHPVQENTLHLKDLEARQAQSDEQLAARLDALQVRLEALEIQGDTDREAFSTVQSRLDAVEASLTSVRATQDEVQTALGDLPAAQIEAQIAIDDLLAAQAETGASLEGIQAAQADAKAVLDDLAPQVAEIDQEVEGLSQAATQAGETIEALEVELQEVSAPVADLQYDRYLLRALDLLTLAELHLTQGNAGLARSEVSTARSLLSGLQIQLPAHNQDALVAILGRLDLVLGNLPGATDLARGDLDIAWQLLLRGLTGAGAGTGLTLTPTSTITTSPSLTATPTVTTTETTTP